MTVRSSPHRSAGPRVLSEKATSLIVINTITILLAAISVKVRILPGRTHAIVVILSTDGHP